MKRQYGLMMAAVSVITTTTALGAGFALYEGSAKGTALGGTVMGRAVDASANFYNPATLCDFTNTVVTSTVSSFEDYWYFCTGPID